MPGNRGVALQAIEGFNDGTRSLAARGAARAEPLERHAGGFELGDAGVEGVEALARQLADAGAVVGAVERQQLPYLLEPAAWARRMKRRRRTSSSS
jgi:hypothetical protein